MNRKECKGQKIIPVAEYITVLDFEDGKVYQYDIEVLDKSDEDVYERFLTNEGHNLNNCEWMIHKNPEIMTL